MRFKGDDIIENTENVVTIDDTAIFRAISEDYYPSDIFDTEYLVEELIDNVPISRIIQEVGDEAKILDYITDEAIEAEFDYRKLDTVISHEKADKWVEKMDDALPYLTDEVVASLLQKLQTEVERRNRRKKEDR